MGRFPLRPLLYYFWYYFRENGTRGRLGGRGRDGRPRATAGQGRGWIHAVALTNGRLNWHGTATTCVVGLAAWPRNRVGPRGTVAGSTACAPARTASASMALPDVKGLRDELLSKQPSPGATEADPRTAERADRERVPSFCRGGGGSSSPAPARTGRQLAFAHRRTRSLAATQGTVAYRKMRQNRPRGAGVLLNALAP